MSRLIAPTNISPGEWKATVDDTLSGPLHTEQMREVDPHYNPAYEYWTVDSWLNGGGQYVADAGCHEHSEANAKLIAAAPALAEALAAIVEDAAANKASILNYKVDAARAALLSAGYTEAK